MSRIFTNSKVQRKIIVSYIVIGLTLVGILSMVYSYLMTNQIIKSRYIHADSALHVSTSSTVLLLEEVYARYFQLFQTDAQLLLYKNDIANEADIQSLIANIAFNDFLVDSIVLVDVKNQTMIDSSSRVNQLDKAPDQGLSKMITDLSLTNSAIRNLIFFPRKTVIDQQEKEYLTITFASNSSDGTLSKVMFVNLDENMLSKLLNFESQSSYMLVVNRFGQIIADSSNRYFNTYYFTKEFVLDQDPNIGADNAYIASIDGEKSFVAHQQSTKFDLTFFSISNYRQITAEVRQSNTIIILLFGFFLILTGVLSIILSKRFYSPIQRLVDQVAKMDDSIPDILSDEFEFIYKALNHMSQRKISDELKSILEGKKAADLGFDWSQMHIVVLQPRLVDLNQDQNKHASEYLWELFQPNITLIDEFGLGALATTEQISKYQQWENHAWIAGVSHKVEKADQVNKCFRQAKAASEFAFTKENIRVQYYHNIVSNETDDNRLQIKNQLHTYIRENFHDAQSSINSLAHKLGYSIGYARQIFKEEMGVPFNEYLISVRIEEAKRLLQETDLTSKEIADRIGIEDVRYFYTIFKSRTTMTAQQFRKQNTIYGRNE
jgi:AraC-like DNA-binding protein